MDKMREEFEAWYSDFDGYGEAHKKELWDTWKASRAALCVELPENCKGMALTVSELHRELDKA
ncbi:MAG: hypothetical protein ACRDBQ_09535 [Shewanella sp.]